MTYAANANRYREAEVMSATPAQLVVLTFDHLLASLRRARVAIDGRQHEVRVESLDRARNAVAELLSTLDREKGGSLASDLDALYTFVFAQLVEIGSTGEVARLDRVIKIVNDLREGFATVAAGATT